MANTSVERYTSQIVTSLALGANKNNSERPVDALAVKNVNYSLTHSLKSRDASVSNKLQIGKIGTS